MDLLNLNENQIITIEKENYEVLNKVKFIEKGGYWIEYKIKNQVGEIFYLNVETNLKCSLYKVLDIHSFEIKMNVIFNNNQYELFEKGNGKVETYYGITDIGLKDEVEYYEYLNTKDSNEILSIEKWKNELEVSLGHIVNKRNIK